MKLLGVTLDKDLNFSEHVSSICKTTSKRIGVLMRLRKLIPTTAKLQIYKAAIMPYFNYCSLAWHFCKGSDKNKLERTNERGLKSSFFPLQNIAIFMYKIIHKLLPNNILDLFESTQSTYNLRNSDFRRPRFDGVKYGKHSLRYFGPYLWDKLLPELRTLPSIQSFKNNIRKADLAGLVDTNSCKNCAICSI